MRILIGALIFLSFFSCGVSQQTETPTAEAQAVQEQLAEKSKGNLFDGFFTGNYFVPSSIDAIDTAPEFLKQEDQEGAEEKLKIFIEKNGIDLESIFLEELKKKSDESLDSLFLTVP